MNELNPQQETPKITKEQIDMITRGERPEGMDYEEFRKHRTLLKKVIQKYLKGRFIFISSDLFEEETPGGKRVMRKTKTFIKKDLQN
jgi:hypothetical protein